ncbi:MAG TPA: GAF domain-containing sensor histidine kinase [Longimicrobiales bacterium]|nr:GAF domain-containing sensor histidine kinase [Longimicrobiales bacterium]
MVIWRTPELHAAEQELPSAGGNARAEDLTVSGGAGRAGRGRDRIRLLWQLSGPALTLLLVALTELRLGWADPLADVSVLLVLAVIYSAFGGGLIPGLASAAITVLYGARLLQGSSGGLDDASLDRFWVVAVATPAVAMVSAYLKGVVDRKRVRDRTTRAIAEAAERRSAFLSEASRALAASLNYDVTLANLAALHVPAFADYCLIYLLEEDGSRIRLAAAAHIDPALVSVVQEVAARHPPPVGSKGNAVSRVIGSGKPEFVTDVIRDVPDLLCEDPAAAEQLADFAPRSYMVVPLTGQTATVGAMVLGLTDSGRRYGAADLAFAEDLARRAAFAVDNARLYEAALAASKAKSDFLAVMSHELKTPLTTIVACTDLLEAEIAGPLNKEQRDQLGHILASAMHLLQLIDEILSFSRMEAGRERVQLEWVELQEFVNETAVLIRPVALDKGLNFRVRAPEEPIRIETDPSKVRQILLNLLSNAVKFTDRGEVSLEAWQEGAEVVFRVRDTGIGIAPDQLERIFEPFWQVEQSASRRAGGTGLGLSVARRLARLLGGDVTVESEPGVGSVFVVRIPAHPSSNGTAEEGAAVVEAEQG